MHEWLMVIIALLIIGVLLDGVRRMRQARRDSLRMNLDMNEDADDGTLDYSAELPSGGARVADRPHGEQAEHLNLALQKAIENHCSPTPKPSPTEQQALNLDESVPMLMDSVASTEPRVEPQLGVKLQPQSENKHPQKPQIQKNPFKRPVAKSLPAPEPKDQPQEVLVFHIESRDEYLRGDDLLKLTLNQGLRYGDMKIFHRHAAEDGEGPILFSMANMVKPGTFDLAAFDTLLTPGVSLFLRLPMAEYNAIDAFESMLTTAKTLADRLNAELRDEDHSVMTRQTVEHYRERIRIFSLRQQLLDKRA